MSSLKIKLTNFNVFFNYFFLLLLFLIIINLEKKIFIYKNWSYFYFMHELMKTKQLKHLFCKKKFLI